MTQAQFSKPAVSRKPRSSAVEDLHAWTITGDAAEVLATLTLPEDTSVAIIPKTARAQAVVQREGGGRLKRAPWIVRPGRTAATNQIETTIDNSAYEPDARARAVLRGVEYARADLRDAGGAYDVEQVRGLLHGVTRQAVDKRVNEGSLLAVPGPSNRRRFPTIQFNDDGTVVEGLKAVQEALSFASPWSVLNFLINPQSGLGGDKPIDRLRAGDVEPVIAAARRIGVQGA